MKPLLLPILIFLLSSCTCPLKKADIPQKLQQLGFTQYTLVDYQKEDNKEYFTFSDWITKRKGDTITFVVIDGEVKDKFKEEVREEEDVEI